MGKDFDDTNFDIKEIGRRAIKYLIEGLMVAIAAYFIPKKGKNGQSLLSIEEVLMIAFCAAATFALLDMYAPSIATTTRQGAGFGIGASIVNWPAAGL
tara:strand:+ start:3817 stop:4110 length:294 start_codon:yes stop_codon:yes gene_type:complete